MAVKIVEFPLQISAPVMPDGAVDGRLTVMVNVLDVPPQPDAEGVTVIVAVIGVDPGLVAVNDGILPLPLAPRPIAVLLFVQL